MHSGQAACPSIGASPGYSTCIRVRKHSSSAPGAHFAHHMCCCRACTPHHHLRSSIGVAFFYGYAAGVTRVTRVTAQHPGLAHQPPGHMSDPCLHTTRAVPYPAYAYLMRMTASANCGDSSRACMSMPDRALGCPLFLYAGAWASTRTWWLPSCRRSCPWPWSPSCGPSLGELARVTCILWGVCLVCVVQWVCCGLCLVASYNQPLIPSMCLGVDQHLACLVDCCQTLTSPPVFLPSLSSPSTIQVLPVLW
jgi:hypothetical protein